MNQESIITKYVPYSDALREQEKDNNFRLLEESLVRTLDYLSSRFSVTLWYDHFTNPKKKWFGDMLFKIRSSTEEIMWVYLIFKTRNKYISIEVDADRVANIRSQLNGFYREQERNQYPTLKLFFNDYKAIEKSLVAICDCFVSTKDNPLQDDVSDINIPMKPGRVNHDGDLVIIDCSCCGASFIKAPRCPECGQLIDYGGNV